MEKYSDIQSKFQLDLQHLKKRKSLLSNLRLLFFILFVIAFYFYVSKDEALLLVTSGIVFLFFMIFVVKSTNVGKKITYIQDALYTVEVIFKDDQPNEFNYYDNEFFNNIYNKDLDIIEGQSLFNRLNKSQSAIGSYRLKHFLSHVLLDKIEIIKRQKAFAELKDKRDFMVEFLTLSKRAAIHQSEILVPYNASFLEKQ
jgi:Mismatch repair ATPase (MutS family)